jgi:hypothetical protein
MQIRAKLAGIAQISDIFNHFGSFPFGTVRDCRPSRPCVEGRNKQ